MCLPFHLAHAVLVFAFPIGRDGEVRIVLSGASELNWACPLLLLGPWLQWSGGQFSTLGQMKPCVSAIETGLYEGSGFAS